MITFAVFSKLGWVLLEGRGKWKWQVGAAEEDTGNYTDFCQLGSRYLLLETQSKTL